MLSSAAWEPGVQRGAGPQEYLRWCMAIKNSCSGGDGHGWQQGQVSPRALVFLSVIGANDSSLLIVL